MKVNFSPAVSFMMKKMIQIFPRQEVTPALHWVYSKPQTAFPKGCSISVKRQYY